MENDLLKKEIACLSNDLRKCYDSRAISFDSSYILMRNWNDNVSAKFVGIPINGAKKNAIWVPKALVSNIQGPKNVWVPKQGWFSFVGELQG